MAAASVLTTLQAELLCPICRDYMNNPVTVPCGHNFCAPCIRSAWKGPRGTFPCPVCRSPHEKRHCRANPQLARLVDLGRLLHSSSSSETWRGEQRRCEEHGQVLSLFCEDDRQLLCPPCSQSPAHRGHLVRPVEEAALHHRRRLGRYVEPLKRQLAEMQKLLVSQDKKLRGLKDEVGKQRDQVVSEMEQLKLFVEMEQEATFLMMEEVDKYLQQKLDGNVTAISDHIDTMNDLLTELAERSVASEGSLLREVKSIQHRWESLEPPPPVCSGHFRKQCYGLPPLCSVFENIAQKFQEEVTLDPHTAHPSLYISEDGKVAIYLKERSKAVGQPTLCPDDIVVLGAEGFSSGRHYWEVQVGDKPEWAVGVCIKPPSGEGQWPLSGQSISWTLQLQEGNFLAGDSVPDLLDLKDKPTKIGVYLDYELGQISFYDAGSRTHIHSLMATFSDELTPYFGVGRDSTPLTVAAVRESAAGTSFSSSNF